MTSTYFNVPSFARAKRHKEDLEKTNPQEPVLNDADEKFLEEQISSEKAPPEAADVPATKITDDGVEKEATKEEQQQVSDAADQPVIIPETQPESGDGETAAESQDAETAPEIDHEETVPEEQSYDDVMKQKAAERVKARKAKKKNSIDLPSQEEAEASTRGFNEQAAKDAAQSKGEKRTWTSYLPSVRPSSKQSTASDRPTSEDSATQRSWTEFATAYVPAIPTIPTWKSKDQDARPPSPVYNEDGTLNEEKTREKQEREISVLLDNLSLSQINNRVFSFSDETQKIYAQFSLVLKDTIAGGPTAYEDMEKLMREAGPKLEAQFKSMPPFVQTLVKSLPAKIGSTLGPEVLAAASEKPGADLKAKMAAEGGESGMASSGINIPVADEKDGAAQKKKRRIPGLKSLLSKEGAVASMLRSTVTFIQTRFPFLASATNVVMSLAVFILMFVFWYCHKRGKEVRLAREAETGEGEVLGEVSGEDDYEDDDEEVEDELEPGVDPEQDVKYEELLKDVEAKANVLNQPDPSDVPLPERADSALDESKDSTGA